VRGGGRSSSFFGDGGRELQGVAGSAKQSNGRGGAQRRSSQHWFGTGRPTVVRRRWSMKARVSVSFSSKSELRGSLYIGVFGSCRAQQGVDEDFIPNRSLSLLLVMIWWRIHDGKIISSVPSWEITGER
jgi:hypothetical protein